MLPDGEEERGEEDLAEWDDDGEGERDERQTGSSSVLEMFVLLRTCSRVLGGIRLNERALHPRPVYICAP